MLSYLDVHLTYTLPVIGMLVLIAQPFINRSEIFKIGLISAIAFVYSTPWDNYIVCNGAWTYSDQRVLFTIGHVPVEEYLFFVVQTVSTSLWTLLCTRWSTPCLCFNHNRRTYLLVRWIPISVWTLTAVVGYGMWAAGRHTFYMGCTLCWACPVIAFLWYGAGNFFAKQLMPCAVSIVAPTAYLCWVDRIALRENVWRVGGATSLNVFPVDDLPLEEALFFFLTNVIVVLAVTGYDKARGMMETYTSAFPLQFAVGRDYVGQLFRAFVTPEYTMPSIVTEDVRKCARVLNVASKSFTAASYLFHSGIRLDLIILYAFCRVTDDMIDDKSLDIVKKKQKLELTETFINELFCDRKSDYDIKKNPHDVKIDWVKYQSQLTDLEISCFRAMSRTAFYLPRKPFYELLAGYRWDIDGRLVRNKADLMEYCNYVAGSVGVLCVFVIMYRCDDEKLDLIKNYDYVIDKAQQMGRVLQLVNIARDIVIDSETLGRCYVPTEYFDNEEEEIRILCIEKNPRSLGDEKLKKYSTRVIQLADECRSESVDALRCLPLETRRAILAAIDIYRGNISAIKSSPTYPTRASLPKLHKMLIGFYSLYIKIIQYIKYFRLFFLILFFFCYYLFG